MARFITIRCQSGASTGGSGRPNLTISSVLPDAVDCVIRIKSDAGTWIIPRPHPEYKFWPRAHRVPTAFVLHLHPIPAVPILIPSLILQLTSPSLTIHPMSTAHQLAHDFKTTLSISNYISVRCTYKLLKVSIFCQNYRLPTVKTDTVTAVLPQRLSPFPRY